MNRSSVLVAAVVLVLDAPAHLLGQTPSGAASTTIEVAVAVREGSRPIVGLSASDFALTDNEVRQDVQVLRADSMPIDLTLVVDTSESRPAVADRLTKDVQQIARLLRSDDEFRLVTVAAHVAELRPTGSLTGAPRDLVPRQIGASAVHDALIAALVKPVAPGRRHLAVAMIDVRDTISYTTADRVREIATRSDALLEIISVRPPQGYRSPTSSVRPRYNDESTLVLAEAAERTGGGLKGRGLFGDTDAVTVVSRALEEFRQSYVLRYAPRGVDESGWHELAVSVPTLPNATVRARKGYYGS